MRASSSPSLDGRADRIAPLRKLKAALTSLILNVIIRRLAPVAPENMAMEAYPS
jgi:hypothetical protein